MKYLLLLSLIFLFSIGSFSQVNGSETSSEIGIVFGVNSFQTDFGEKGDIKSNISGNLGISVGGLYFFNFQNHRVKNPKHWFKSHVKIKTEVSYVRADIDHFGVYTDLPDFEAMHATASLFNVGAQLEYHFYDLSEFTPKTTYRFSPYVGIGPMYHYSKPTVTTELSSFPTAYLAENSIKNEAENTYSLLFSVGTRVKINYKSDLILDARWSSYMSDYIDGLKPQYAGNKANDWMTSVSIAYVYYPR